VLIQPPTLHVTVFTSPCISNDCFLGDPLPELIRKSPSAPQTRNKPSTQIPRPTINKAMRWRPLASNNLSARKPDLHEKLMTDQHWPIQDQSARAAMVKTFTSITSEFKQGLEFRN